jgi:hypothetical protein
MRLFEAAYDEKNRKDLLIHNQQVDINGSKISIAK